MFLLKKCIFCYIQEMSLQPNKFDIIIAAILAKIIIGAIYYFGGLYGLASLVGLVFLYGIYIRITKGYWI